MKAIVNRCSLLLTAAPLLCAASFIALFLHVRLILGRWPVVYRDSPTGWLVDAEQFLALQTYLLAVAALFLWIPANGLAAGFVGRAPVLRRLLLFVIGWALLYALFKFDPTGSMEWFLD